MSRARKLGGDITYRVVMLRGMITLLLENDKIEITVTCAEEVRSLTKKLITLAQENDLHSQRMTPSFITRESMTHKLFLGIVLKYTNHKGRYTHITRIGSCRDDTTKMAVVGLI